MVKKLLKYEFISYLRTLVPMYIILLAIGVVNRFIQIFENDHFSYDIVFTSSVIALSISIIVCVVMTVIVGVVRFHKNLYSSEGYLTFTLPVTSGQLIFTKLVMLIAFTLIGLAVIILSGSIAMLGEVLVEVFRAIGYLAKQYFNHVGVHGAFYIVEFIILLFVSVTYQYLLYYSCITIGQTAKKNRVFMAFLTYFVYYIITQVIGTIFVIIGMVFGEMGIIAKIVSTINAHPYASTHIIFVTLIAFFTVLCVALYFVNRYIMNRKLNLE